jgi:hypothetical protein
MNQIDLTAKFSERPQNFAWFLGAGTSRSSGLPTAADIIWDLKRRYYCKEENQEITQQDLQNEAVKARIQSFMDSRGFPAQWASEEYTTYFEKIFGTDRERQRQYIQAIFSEDKVTLSVGNRALGALMSSGACRVVFTTNFDSVVEKSVAEVSGKSLSAYHLEGAHSANKALNNEEYPLYCKIHGDFRYDSIKNLSTDLSTQNAELARCLVNASTRFGFIVAGYSGRDESVMKLFQQAITVQNAFPHGLFWTGMKGSTPLPVVTALLQQARDKGIDAQYIDVDTFDSLMLGLWRNYPDKTQDLDVKVRKARLSNVAINIPVTGQGNPLLRLNALPILDFPRQCLSLSFKTPKEWADLRRARASSENQLILTKSDTVLCWGKETAARSIFGTDLTSASVRDLPIDLRRGENLQIKNFLEEALCQALAKDNPLLTRTRYSGAYLIVDPHSQDVGALDPLFQVVGKTSGTIQGLFSTVTEKYPEAEKVQWAECLRLSVDSKNGQLWLLIDPDIWIWPTHARRDAEAFLDKRRGNRYNQQHNQILSAWVQIILGAGTGDAEIALSAFADGTAAENPSFRIGVRTAYTKRLTA